MLRRGGTSYVATSSSYVVELWFVGNNDERFHFALSLKWTTRSLLVEGTDGKTYEKQKGKGSDKDRTDEKISKSICQRNPGFEASRRGSAVDIEAEKRSKSRG